MKSHVLQVSALLAVVAASMGCVVHERDYGYRRQEVIVERPAPPRPVYVVRQPAPPPRIFIQEAPPRPEHPIILREAPPVAEQVVVIRSAPPEGIVEQRPHQPGRDFLWLPGYWVLHGRSWAWVSGRWERPPHPGAVWVPHRWEPKGPEFHFSVGFWR